jgi:hypothetical protein
LVDGGAVVEGGLGITGPVDGVGLHKFGGGGGVESGVRVEGV